MRWNGCLASFGPKLYHAGIRQPTARSTLADANENRDWRFFADFAQVLIQQAAALYVDEPCRFELQAAAYALDSTTIDLCLSLFPWATFRRHKAAIKLHTLLTLQGNFPTVIIVSTGSVHDVNILDQLVWEAGSFYIMDRGYLDFARWHRIHQCGAFFVTRARQNFRCTRRYRTSKKQLSQQGVGMKAALPQPIVSKIESNSGRIALSRLLKVLAALDLELVVRPKSKQNTSTEW